MLTYCTSISIGIYLSLFMPYQQGPCLSDSYSPHIPKESIVRIEVSNASGVVLSVGSGIVVNDNKHVATCAHVLEGGTSFSVYAWGSIEPLVAKPYVNNDKLDCAILVLPSGKGLLPVKFADDLEFAEGKHVILVGYSFDQHVLNREIPRLSSGIISTGCRQLNSVFAPIVSISVDGMLEIQGFADNGFSGGPVLSLQGEVVGLISIRFEAYHSWDGYIYAIPSTAITKFLHDVFKEQ